MSSQQFKIADNCGGISVDLARDYAFRFGRPPEMPPTRHSVGQFGVGMKRALFKLGTKFVIDSRTDSSRFVVEVDVAEWRKEPKWEFAFEQLEEGADVSPDEQGTTINVTSLHPDRPRAGQAAWVNPRGRGLGGGYAPAPRRRSPRVVSLAEREEISRGLAEGLSLRAIATRLGRAPSSISREIARHGGRAHYRAARADERAWARARRRKLCKLAAHPRLRELVARRLAEDWSPQQISGWLARTYPGEQALQVSTETIYRSLFVQARGVLRKELIAHLRTHRTMRRSKHARTKGQGRGGIVDAVSIRERPAEAQDRAVPGHWEGDLLAGSANTHIATLVERQSRYLVLVKVDGKDSATVVDALAAHVQALPTQLRASLTWDRGMELADHKRFSIATDVAVYFCDPQSPWQRGTNENTNGLLRQYFPRQTDLSHYGQADLDAVAARLNTRPRKTLDYETPADRLAAIVASTP